MVYLSRPADHMYLFHGLATGLLHVFYYCLVHVVAGGDHVSNVCSQCLPHGSHFYEAQYLLNLRTTLS